MEWQPIATAPEGVEVVLYFPPLPSHFLGRLVRVDYYPVSYPRKPTHWLPIPEAPK